VAIHASFDVSVIRLRLVLKISAPTEGMPKAAFRNTKFCPVKSSQQNPDRSAGESFCIVSAAEALRFESRLVGAFLLVFLHHRSEANLPTMSRAVELYGGAAFKLQFPSNN
jgi:hypothetical protein